MTNTLDHSSLVSIVTLLMLCDCIAGCGNQHTANTTLAEAGHTEWNSTEAASSIPGIDEASVTHLQYGEHHIVLWIDIAKAIQDSGGSDRHRSGMAESIDGRRAEWKCEIVDNTCQVTIGRRSFDIENGKLFLVSTTDGEAKTLQLEHDTAGITHSEDSLKTLAQTNRQIHAFFNNESKTE